MDHESEINIYTKKKIQIMFNPVKSVCVTFKPKNSKLSCPSVRLDSNILEYISQSKYLGFMFNTNAQDDEDMLRQMRTLYIRSNKLLRTFHYCATVVKLELFKSYCTSFYCCYLWTAYKKSTFDRLRVAFNNAYRRVLGQPWRCSASAMYANLVLITLKQLLENQHLDSYND